MPRYTVHVTAAVSTAVKVEAEDQHAAIDAAFEIPGMPPTMAYQAFGDRPVDCGDWEAAEVANQAGEPVWSERDERVPPRPPAAVIEAAKRVKAFLDARDHGENVAAIGVAEVDYYLTVADLRALIEHGEG